MNPQGYNSEELYKNQIHIYAEANPNPQSMKFVVNFMLVKDGSVHEFKRGDENLAPLATAIFTNFSFIQIVFISTNFITLTKEGNTDWYEILPLLRSFLFDYFDEGSPVFTLEEALNDASVNTVEKDPTILQICQILEDYVKPAVEMDGGAIEFHSFNPADGHLKVSLKGSCNGCPSSMVTLKQGIQNIFSHMMPEVREVSAV